MRRLICIACVGAVLLIAGNAFGILGDVISQQKISDVEGGFTGVLQDLDQFGISVSGLGDLDGDGVMDLAVGANNDDDGGSDRGAVWVLFLNSDGTAKAHQKISDTAGGFTGTLDNSDGFGQAMATLGDFDGDGVTDLVVGAFADDDGGADRGAVWLLFLNSNGTVKSHQKISATVGGFTGVLESGDGFGYSVAAVGDLDGDNVDDIAVGATGDDDGGSNHGAVWILFLKSDGTVKSHQKISDTEGNFTGTLGVDRFAFSMDSLDDIDGDGIIELAVAARNDDDGGFERGAVWILFLNTDGTVNSHQKISDTEGGFTGTLDNSDLLGSGVWGIGDFDCDGIEDLAVGAQYDDDGGQNRGAIWLMFLNPDGTVKGQHKISDTQGGFTGTLLDWDVFGERVAPVGDLNGDGVIDLAAGTPGDDDGGYARGAVWMLFLEGTVCTTQVSVQPAYGITNCATPMTYTFHADRSGLEQMRGYEVTFSVSPSVATIANVNTDIVESAYLSSVGTTAFYAIDNGGGVYTVSCAILGGTAGATGPGDFFTVTLTPVSEGTSAISITSLKVRDLDNLPLPASGTDGSVQIDCTVPTMSWPLIEADSVCYNTPPTFAVFRFQDDVNLHLAEYQVDALGWDTVFVGIDSTNWTGDGWVLPGFAGLGEGGHTVYFRVRDDAGNWNGEGTPDTYSWYFIKDTTPPAPPSDLSAGPGHNKVHLSWTNPSGDASFEGVEIRRVGWGDYPQYGTPGPPAPSYPANETEGVFVVQTSGEVYADSLMPRDIYYYAAFSYDCAGNYSVTDPGAQDRSTSYFLADINPAAVGDGVVAIMDLALFSMTFGEAQGDAGWNAEGDFGPTNDFSRLGIPLPDDIVDFEDLMILAMDYGEVMPWMSPGQVLAQEAEPLPDRVHIRIVEKGRENGLVTFALILENDATTLKGMSIDVEFGTASDLQAVDRGNGLARRGEVFFGTIAKREGIVNVSIAALGVNRSLDLSGEVARIIVREKESTTATLRLASIDLRDVDNNRDAIEPDDEPIGMADVPSHWGLGQNHPNPFNPSTMIEYDVPDGGGPLTLDVFDVRGQLVRRLVNGAPGAGSYTIEWDGKDNAGRPVSSGIYFYRLKTSGQTLTRKAVLLR